MESGTNTNWGKKGACLTKFIIGVLLFVGMLIWIYTSNREGLS